jgi:hypothetical protein
MTWQDKVTVAAALLSAAITVAVKIAMQHLTF